MELFFLPGLGEEMLAEALSLVWAAGMPPLLLCCSIQEAGKEGSLEVQPEV